MTCVTVTVTVAASESTVPSLATYVNVSVPLKLAFGVYVAVLPVTDTVPFAPLVAVNVRASPSMSAPESVTSTDWFSRVAAVASSAVGLSLTGVTVMLTVAAADVATPSFAMNVNESAPLKLAFGVYVATPPDRLRVPLEG